MTVDPVALSNAITRSQNLLWNQQRADGSWESLCDVGPSVTAQVVLALDWLGAISDDERRAAARWLETQQAPDGSFVAFPFAPQGDVATTAAVWGALQIGHASPSAIDRAWAYVASHGGMDAVIAAVGSTDLSAVFLALSGRVDATKLPTPPLFLAIARPLQWLAESKVNVYVLSMMLQMGVTVRRLRGEWGADGPSGHCRAREIRGIRGLLTRYQNPSGSWNEYTVQTAFALVALRAMGVPDQDAGYQRGLQWLRAQAVTDGAWLRFFPFGSSVWTTAFDARALLYSGVSATDPRMVRALQWLVDAQCVLEQPFDSNRQCFVERRGGWGFERDNQLMPDTDDTGVTLSVLGLASQTAFGGPVEGPLGRQIHSSVARAWRWLDGMQNCDGGWAAFIHGMKGKPPGPIMTRPLNVPFNDPLKMLWLMIDPPFILGDPATEDLTARIVHGLATTGLSPRHKTLRRALKFLKRQQCRDGSVWGRWICNFLTGTSYTLLAAEAAGVSPDEPWITAATEWLIARQNSDGSWGESYLSYADPSLAGQGSAVAPLTALVASALISIGRVDSPAVERAINYLIVHQRPDGSWSSEHWLTPVFPPDTFYVYPEATRYYGLEALGRYQRARS